MVGPRLATVSVRLGIVAALSSAGCQAFFGVDDYEPGSPTATTVTSGRGGGGGSTASSGHSSASGEGGGGAPVDPTCVCLDVPPPDWTGPFTVYSTAAPDPPLAACSDGPLVAQYFDGAPGPATCNPCACSAPPIQCHGPTLLCYGSTDCSGSAQDWSNPVQSVGCYYYPEQTLSCLVQGGGTATVGNCASSGGEKTVSWWKTTHGICNVAPSPTGCAEGSCYLKGADAKVCIAHQGPHLPCPGPEWTQIKAYASQDDQRMCSGCACGAPNGGACSAGTYTFYTDPACFANALPAAAACKQMSPNGSLGESAKYSPGQVSQAASCVAAGGAPGGVFTGLGDVTLCCQG